MTDYAFMDDSKHLPLAPRDLMILAVLSEGPLHGYGMIKAVADQSPSKVLLDPANLYRVLRRMRGLGWIEHHPGAEVRQRTYALTDQGRAVLTSEAQRLNQLLAKIQPGAVSG